MERLRDGRARRRRSATRPRTFPTDAEVVVSTAIGDDNPELALARERGQRVIHRGELLAELCAERRLIAIAGTHGKTTTAAMVGLGPARGRRRPRLLSRRRASGRRARRGGRQRRLGRGGVGGRRGGRERRQLPAPRAGGGGDHQRRDGPSLALGLAARSCARPSRALPPAAGGAGVGPGVELEIAGTEPLASTRARRARPSWRSRCPAATTCSTPARHSPALQLAGFDVDAAAAALAGGSRECAAGSS